MRLRSIPDSLRPRTITNQCNTYINNTPPITQTRPPKIQINSRTTKAENILLWFAFCSGSRDCLRAIIFVISSICWCLRTRPSSCVCVDLCRDISACGSDLSPWKEWSTRWSLKTQTRPLKQYQPTVIQTKTRTLRSKPRQMPDPIRSRSIPEPIRSRSTLKVCSHQTRMKWINHAIRA